jgi:hypothetical protein
MMVEMVDLVLLVVFGSIITLIVLVVLKIIKWCGSTTSTPKLSYKDILEQKGFHIDKTISLPFRNLYIDDGNKRFAFGQEVYNYSDLIAFELIENGNSKTVDDPSLADIVIPFFGSEKKTIPTCTSLAVNVTLQNLKSPLLVFPFITSEIQKNSGEYKTQIHKAKEFCAVLSYIQNKKS